MLKLFRRLRLNLIDNGNFKKYLIYAIGEIILVVIGILIALQVNNWNQNRLERILEEKILLEIANNLKDDIVDVDDEIESFKIVIKTDSILIQHFQSKYPFNDSIGAFIHVFQMSPHLTIGKNGYNLLESKGIELLSNDSLRIQITDLYERKYPYYNTYAQERFNMIEAIIQPYLAKHFYLESHDKWPYNKRVPLNYDLLFEENTIIPLLQTSLFHASVMREKSTYLKKDVEDLQSNIRKYLEK